MVWMMPARSVPPSLHRNSPDHHRAQPVFTRRVRVRPGRRAIYLLLGIVFAWLYAFFDQVSDGPLFICESAVPQGSRVYFSFTALTSGFGDLAAATDVGRALVVLETMIGQLYLVTVIGVLVGSFGRR